MPYYVYLLTDQKQTSLHAGLTPDLGKRIRDHKEHSEGKAKGRGLDRLVYYEEFDDILPALAREKQIKSWPRARKNALVSAANPAWDDLSSELSRELRRETA